MYRVFVWCLLISAVLALSISICTSIEWYNDVTMKQHAHDDIRNTDYPKNRDTEAAFQAGFNCGIRQERHKQGLPTND